MIYVVAIIAAIAGLLFGFDEGIIAGAMHLIRAEFGVTPPQEGMISAAVPFGAIFGAIVAGHYVDLVGRKRLLIYSGVIFAVGAGLAASAGGVITLTLCRLLLGFAIGAAALVAPMFISESAPAERRGMLVSAYQLAITLGILGAYMVNLAASDSWRTMFAVGIVPGIALFTGMLFMKNTPAWLARQGHKDEARSVAARLRGAPENSPEVDRDIERIEAMLSAERTGGNWRELFDPTIRPALIVGIGLFLLQQLSGINAVIYFAPQVFEGVGFAETSVQLIATIGIGVVNVVFTLLGMALIDRLGRRKLLIGGFAITGAALAVVAICANLQGAGVIAALGILIYIAAFATSLGPIAWLMMSEVFPLNVRGHGMALSSLANWGFNFVVVLLFPILLSTLGLEVVFIIFAFCCLFGIYFTLRFVPETRGVTLEEIEAHLLSGRPFRELGPPH